MSERAHEALVLCDQCAIVLDVGRTVPDDSRPRVSLFQLRAYPQLNRGCAFGDDLDFPNDVVSGWATASCIQ